jgi:arylsulfatase A-like enzyme
MGDHWLGEKDLFHDPSVKVPLIIYDPRRAADATRGTTSDALVESIDLLPTFLAAKGADIPDHILEGRSLIPLLQGQTPPQWRDYAISEYDYSTTPMAEKLGLAPRDARLFMVADKRWKFIHAEGGFRPMLFDRETDPDELNDLARGPDHAEIIDKMYHRLGQWARRLSQRTTLSESRILNMRRSGGARRRGITLGVYDDNDIDPELMSKYRGPAPKP